MQEALRIEPSLPEAHALLGVWAGGYDNYDWHEAERHWRVAMSGEPSLPTSIPGTATITWCPSGGSTRRWTR